jgi:hypothetical protein
MSPSEIAEGLSADERRVLLNLKDEWHLNFRSSEIIPVARLAVLGLVTFIDNYEGPEAKRTDLGRSVASLLEPAP